MKFLKRLVISTVILVISLYAGYQYVLSTYGVDLIRTAKELKVLIEPVDEDKLCPNKFKVEDMVDVQTLVNESVENFITYTMENGYYVNFDNLPDEMKHIIKLTDKQVGAIASLVIEQEMDGKLLVNNKPIGISLKQVDYNETETGALFNSVFALNINELLKDIPSGFPYDYVKPYIPETFYISSTVNILQSEVAFSYDVTHSSLTINNLNSEDTLDLYNTLNKILNIGSLEELNTKIGETLMNALVGNEENNGIAYTLKEIGAKDYDFISEDGKDYFVVDR